MPTASSLTPKSGDPKQKAPEFDKRDVSEMAGSTPRTLSQAQPLPAFAQAALPQTPVIGEMQLQLSVGSSNDPAEREANVIAENIVRGGEPPDNFSHAREASCRSLTDGPEVVPWQSGTEIAARQSDYGVVGARLTGSPSAGAPLDASTGAIMSSHFGHDFADVRIHTGDDAAQAANNISARAFTLGRNIYFGAGRFDPRVADGKKLLAHELTHVIQQERATAVVTVQRAPENPDGGVPNTVSAPSPKSSSDPGAPPSPSPHQYQSDLTDDEQKIWDANNVDEIISGIKARAAQWKAFSRGKGPDLFSNLPRGGSEPSELAGFLENPNYVVDPAFKLNVFRQLGREMLPYLTEMAAFIPEYAILIDLVPGMAYVNPNHKYTLKVSKETSANDIYGFFGIPLSDLTVEYENSFGWHWTKALTASTLSWKVGVSKTRGSATKGAGLAPMPAGVSINVEAVATPAGYSYWGFEDLPGIITLVNGPSVSAGVRGLGGKIVSGGIIDFWGSGGAPIPPLSFMNTVSKLEVKLTTPNFEESKRPEGSGA